MYDLAIIGGGPAGYVAAERAGAAGLSVVLFEKNSLGGVCLNEGCIPTKTLLYSAKVYNYALHGDKYGIDVEGAAANFPEIMARKNKVVKKLVAGVKAAMKAVGVEVRNEQALISGESDGHFLIHSESGDLECRKLLICTGSRAMVPPIPGLSEAGDRILTNKEILDLGNRPDSLVIIGGGVIGMEFASFFNTLGTKVTVIEMLPKILGPMDSELSEMLLKTYAKKGIDFKLGCKVAGIEGGTVIYTDPDGNEYRAEGEKILVSVGRRAVLDGFGLENLSVETDRGIKVNERMETSVPGVYAAGDVTGFSMLAHTASREGEVAVNNILGKDDRMSYRAIPGIVYTNPEVAGVGITEEQAAAKGGFIVKKLPMSYSGRFVAENERENGLCKIIAEEKTGKVVGMHFIGNPCSEIIQSACIAIENEMTVEQIQKVVFPHPTVSEIIKETAFTF
ncbi:dihydrolipoyl dehydrogenase [Bacteroides sp. CAG:1060]|nr:dihydrolipoyl dehydrogenase [Bacteroides sp. CAG:1060]